MTTLRQTALLRISGLFRGGGTGEEMMMGEEEVGGEYIGASKGNVRGAKE